ncbi:helix-turn-helix domain-containing protein [Streptomyces xanthophaeus]|uniref:helix-turn-helix domain-containing protein n=1 Tax=Streptomyces xanthophaeus TaxID=67385 RepID=UPI00264A01E8|nr:helix-turn-helix transcriptional regulator [Streptomyces xanthophaeus]WKD36564.1 helix-turn-helix domain-containing protein [Streptomyces xanthophaeus]
MRSEETVRERFGRLIADAARQTGRYDIDGRGGKAALARATGMAESAVGRMLRGESLPDARFFEPIAKAVDIDVRVLLIEAGIVSPESLATPSQTGAPGVGSDSITLDEAANALGIFSPIGREMFAAAVERLQRTERASESDDGGGTAAQA